MCMRVCVLPTEKAKSGQYVSTHTHACRLWLPPYRLQCAGDVRLHLRLLREDQAGQQGGALLGRQRAQDVLEQQLGQQQLVAADLTGHAALQLHRPAAVHVLEGLQHLRRSQ